MNKKIAMIVGAIVLALNVNAAPVVVPAPSCAGAVIWQQQHAAEYPAKHDGTNPNSVLWYAGSVVLLLAACGILEIVMDW